jgi:hypothetical protein
MDTVNTFATFITNLAWLALVVVAIVAVMYWAGTAMQSAARRRMIAATKRGYAAAGKPVEPRAERRNQVTTATKRAA